MTQSNDSPLDVLPQKIEAISELLALSVSAFVGVASHLENRRMEQLEVQATIDREQRASEYLKIQQLLAATAQANAANSQQISQLIEVERTHERRTNSIVKSVMAITSDVKETVIGIKTIARAMERQNRELSDTLRQQSRDFFDALDRHQDQIDAIIHYSDIETLEDN